MKKLIFIIIVLSLFMVGCSNTASEDYSDNVPVVDTENGDNGNSSNDEPSDNSGSNGNSTNQDNNLTNNPTNGEGGDTNGGTITVPAISEKVYVTFYISNNVDSTVETITLKKDANYTSARLPITSLVTKPLTVNAGSRTESLPDRTIISEDGNTKTVETGRTRTTTAISDSTRTYTLYYNNGNSAEARKQYSYYDIDYTDNHLKVVYSNWTEGETTVTENVANTIRYTKTFDKFNENGYDNLSDEEKKMSRMISFDEYKGNYDMFFEYAECVLTKNNFSNIYGVKILDDYGKSNIIYVATRTFKGKSQLCKVLSNDITTDYTPEPESECLIHTPYYSYKWVEITNAE